MKYASKIIRGRGEGRRIGFPTINFEVPENFPEKPGIYAGWAYVGGGKKPAVFHYGAIPTFGIETPSLEAHLLSAGNAAALPETAEFEFLEFLRPVLKFGSVAELQAAIAEDVRRTADILRLPS